MKERQMLSLNAFKGVDLSSAPTMVSQSRASYSVNMINDNGINHKRPGWDERFEFGGRINGIYHYVNGAYSAIIVYAETSFYHIVGGAVEQLDKITNPQFKDNRVQFFLHKERVYIVGCGEYLVYGTWDGGNTYSLKRVSEAEDTYVPSTLYVNDNGEKEVFEKINILTNRRRNIFKLNSDIMSKEFELETQTLAKRISRVVCGGNEMIVDDSGNIYFERKNYRLPKEQSAYSCNCRSYGGVGGAMVLYLLPGTYENLYEDENGDTYCKKCSGLVATEEQLYEITDYLEPIGNAVKQYANINLYRGVKITLPEDLRVNGTEIELEYASIDSVDDPIKKCTFGGIFGAFGNSDRLFLSGNPSMPNCDFYSEYDDFTYFTEGRRTAMGSDDVPITGYMRLSDNVLATLKADNTTEPTIYYRSAVEVENSDGYTDIEFTRWAGGINEGCVNPHTVVNLAGDDIFVSPNGVYGVVQIQNTSKNDRYIRQRDMLINAELRKRDLKEAVSFVYQNRYYLSLGNGECYVADPRYKNYVSEDIDGSFNYEWWKWTNVPARVFANVGGELWFGDSDGRICRFDDKFCDRSYSVSDKGTVMVDEDTIAYDAALTVSVGDRVKLVTDSPTDLFCKYLEADEYELADGAIKCSAEMIVRVYLGQELYVDNVGESGLAVGEKYVVSDVDRGKCTFKLVTEGGEAITPATGGFILHRAIGQKELVISEVDEENSTIKVKDNYGTLDITAYNGATPDITRIEFIHVDNVCSEWYTPVFDLGAPQLHKTLLRLNVTIDSNVRGSLSVGYETNDKLAYIGASAGKVFSFEDFSFNDFSFSTGFTVTHSQKVKARNFNYIMFRFVSDNDSDCAIDNFSAEYTYNGGRFAGMR